MHLFYPLNCWGWWYSCHGLCLVASFFCWTWAASPKHRQPRTAEGALGVGASPGVGRPEPLEGSATEAPTAPIAPPIAPLPIGGFGATRAHPAGGKHPGQTAAGNAGSAGASGATDAGDNAGAAGASGASDAGDNAGSGGASGASDAGDNAGSAGASGGSDAGAQQFFPYLRKSYIYI